MAKLENLYCIAAIKSKKNQYISASQGYAEFCQFNNPKKIIGTTDYQLAEHVIQSQYYNYETMVEEFILEDERTFCGESLLVFVAALVHNNPTYLLCHKAPYREGNKIVGSFFQNTILPQQNIHSLKYYLNNPDIILPNYTKKFLDIFNLCPSQKYGLSKREMQTIIGLTQGGSARQIGEKLQLSRRTVESYIRNIKDKLSVQTQTEIVVKAMQEELV